VRELIRRGGVLGEVQPGPETVDSSQRSRICAAIVTYNIGEAIHRCFDSIKAQVGHVLIVDNGSGEPTRRELDRLAAFDSVTMILNERNEGVAHAFNQAVEWARSKGFQWILTLDHDSEATPGMVDKLVSAYAALERQGIQNVGVVGANPYDVNIQHFLLNGPEEDEENPLEEEIEVISSGSLIALRVFDKIGLFNEDLFVYYVDTEFCIRLGQGGFRVYVCPEAVLLHKEGSKKSHQFLWRHPNYDHYGKIARYYLTRNTIYMMRRYSLAPIHIHEIVRRNCKDHVKILLFDEERFSTLWFSLRGLVDGLRGKVGPLNSVDLMGPKKS
jgi:rhamnosyltransferase